MAVVEAVVQLHGHSALAVVVVSVDTNVVVIEIVDVPLAISFLFENF